jgi:hypothetical protein
VTTQLGQESTAAGLFLGKLFDLAGGAGGEPPRPEKPSTQAIRALQALSGNAQLLKIHEQRVELERCIVEWSQLQEKIAKRLPRWERLKELCNMATGLPEAQEISVSISAIESTRGLLSDPDPVPPLIQKVLGALRQKLISLQSLLDTAFEREQSRLEGSDVWRRLSQDQRDDFVYLILNPSSRLTG